jgi:hypothetical protein
MSYYGNNNQHQPMLDKEFAIAAAVWIGIGTFVLGGGVASCAYIKPKWNVWSAQMQGEAEYAQAEQNRRITVLEAEAKLEAAKSLAAAEIERAKGVAQANEIIGKSLKDNEAYLRWQWIQNLENGNNSVIYVPTEAGLPILEAGKR